MNVKKKFEVGNALRYVLGLDIGIASVGWCLLGSYDSIIALGVRAFDKPESKEGKPFNVKRREKRLSRRRLRRRVHRLLRARQLFNAEGLLVDEGPEQMATPENAPGPWDLRVDGLNRRLEPGEWARVIYHLIKFRGFHSNRKSELAEAKGKDKDKETGKVLAGLQDTQNKMNALRLRTPAELASQDASFALHKRNKAGDYSHSFSRNLLAVELGLLFDAQRSLGNPHAGEDFEKAVTDIFWSQRPTLTGGDMLKLIGRCTFEPSEFRAPKACHSAERFIWLSKLNHLRINHDGDQRPLTLQERFVAASLPFELKSALKYKTLRSALKRSCGFPDAAKFVGLSYRADSKDPESSILFDCQGWQQIREAYDKAGLKAEWQELANQPGKLDEIGHALTVCKTDDEIRAELTRCGFSQIEIEALLPVSFKGFINLSLVAVGKLLPHLEQGLRYDEAARQVYGDHRARPDTAKLKYLPIISHDEIRNPVVYRALNQARKVVNAIIREYGPPQRVHIEFARELAKPFEERDQIKKGQDRFRDEKLANIEAFAHEFGFRPHPKNQDLLKWRLYREQGGRCAYSLEPLAPFGDVSAIFRDNGTQIDHILPHSRSFDDSQNNKVLVLVKENQNKGDRTPYEYLDGASEGPRWQAFSAWVKATPGLRQAKRQRLLRKDFGETEAEAFFDRNLHDTRYIAKFFSKYVEGHLQLAEGSDAKRCVAVNGQLTAFLRTRWGLLKDRAASDLHHALDAAVIAACGHGLVKRLSDYSRRGELEFVRNGYTDPATGEVVDLQAVRQLEKDFPLPYPGFREELLKKLSPEADQPILVSRAPKRRTVGAAHQETIRSVKKMATAGVSTLKTPLTDLKMSDLAQLAGKDDPRNQPLYEAIQQRLAAFGGDGKKAFGPEQPPLCKPNRHGEASHDKQGKPVIVRNVKLVRTQKNGLQVRGGIADNDSMIRTDVFQKNGRHYLVPVYVADLVRGVLPDRAIVANKTKSDWNVIDENFQFLFSLHQNDFICVKLKGNKQLEGYYSGCHSGTGNINVWTHDRQKSIGKDGLIEGVGVKTAISIDKFHVDVLGRKFKLDNQDKRKGFVRDGIKAYRAYQATGLHLTLDVADEWMARLEAGEDVEPPLGELHIQEKKVDSRQLLLF